MLRPLTAAPLLAVLVLAALPRLAAAQMYRCVDRQGNRHYSQTIPRACLGLPVEQLNAQGIVIKRILPPPSPAKLQEEKAAKERARQRAEAQQQQEHRDQALLATYTSVRDIERARAQALASNERDVSALNERIAELERLRARQENRVHAAGKSPPQALVLALKSTESDLAGQRQVLATKQQEVARINAKYDADRKRFIELTGDSGGGDSDYGSAR